MVNHKMTVTVDDKELTLVVSQPNDKQETDADIYSSQVFAKLAREKNEDGSPAYMVRAKLDEFLRDCGIYTEKDFNNLSDIADRINSLESKLYAGQMSKKEGRKLAVQLRIARYELLVLLNRKAAYDVNTIEHHCQNARMDYLITECIRLEDGSKIFKSVADYKTDTDIKPHILPCITKLASMVSSYDEDYEKKLPENKFLIKYGFCNEALDLVDPETGKRVNEDGDFVNEDGELIDADGNVVDALGNKADRELGDFFDDEEVATPESNNETEDVTSESGAPESMSEVSPEEVPSVKVKAPRKPRKKKAPQA
jgi:hypothetical protein